MLNGTYGFGLLLGRVLWNDPGAGVLRHADAGYEIAKQCWGVGVGFADGLMCRNFNDDVGRNQ